MHPNDADRRVVARGKGNYSQAPASIEFRIETRELHINDHFMEIGVAEGIGETTLTAADLLAPRQPETKAATGRNLITAALEDGEWHNASEILSKLEDVEIGDREARRLAEDLGIERKRSEGFPSHALSRSPGRARVGVPHSHTSRTSRTAVNTGISSSPATPASSVDRQVREGSTGLIVVPDPDLELDRLTAKFPELDED